MITNKNIAGIVEKPFVLDHPHVYLIDTNYISFHTVCINVPQHLVLYCKRTVPWNILNYC